MKKSFLTLTFTANLLLGTSLNAADSMQESI